MTTAIEPLGLDTSQLLALPDDGFERDLLAGRLRERPMTRRNRRHSRTEARIAALLDRWLDEQPEPRGEVLSGEAGFRLRRNPDTTVGIDVAYISAVTAGANREDTSLIEGVPVLAVEILSPSDTHEDISDKIAEYLYVGVALVWLIDPAFRTVTVYNPHIAPALFNISQHLDGGIHLPGFRAAVSDVFGI